MKFNSVVYIFHKDIFSYVLYGYEVQMNWLCAKVHL